MKEFEMPKNKAELGADTPDQSNPHEKNEAALKELAERENELARIEKKLKEARDRFDEGHAEIIQAYNGKVISGLAEQIEQEKTWPEHEYSYSPDWAGRQAQGFVYLYTLKADLNLTEAEEKKTVMPFNKAFETNVRRSGIKGGDHDNPEQIKSWQAQERLYNEVLIPNEKVIADYKEYKRERRQVSAPYEDRIEEIQRAISLLKEQGAAEAAA